VLLVEKAVSRQQKQGLKKHKEEILALNSCCFLLKADG
jgi:hypothetical protein